jgi:lambda repressor-like predicted transcriptional regulator
MRQRVGNPKHTAYANYGARGIQICARWKSFAAFLQDLGPRPPGTSLDRIDNDLGYFKENCRWATRKEQQNNQRACVYLTHEGHTQTLAQWAREVGLPRQTIDDRLKRGYSMEDALRPPVVATVTFGNETHPIRAWAVKTGIKWHTLRSRLRRGWSLERALHR